MRRLLLILALAFASIAAGAQTLVNGSWAVPIANEGVTGTTTNKLVKLTGAPSTAIITATTDTVGAVGICAAGCTTTGNATVVQWGLASCVFDGATTAGDYVAISSSTAGDCHDAGSSRPGSGQIIGRVLSTNASGGTYLVSLAGLDDQGATAGSGTVNSGTAGQMTYYATSTNAVSGNTNANISGGTLTLGVAGSQAGGVGISGSTSGVVSILPGAGAAGTYNFNLPTSAGAAKQLLLSGGGGSTAQSYIDFPDSKSIPFAICVNGTGATGVTTTTSVGAACRAGTNNKDAFIGPFTTSDSATFKVHLPTDWDSSTAPSLSVDVASTDSTNGHTIILQASTRCSKLDGSTSDDVAYNAAQAMGTITLGAGGANQTWTTTLSSLTTTGCSAPGIMWVKITRTTDTATNVELYEANITIPRLLTVQAN